MKKYVNESDDMLVRLYQEGNNEAFDTLLMRYDEYIHTYIRFSIADEDLLEDIFQEVFIKVMTVIRAGKYKAQGRFKPWLSRITHNMIMDHFRQDKNSPYVMDKDERERLAPLDEELNVEETMLHKENLDEVKEWLLLLDPEQQEVVRMRFWYNMSFKEIADEKGISINTALGRMRYALKNLRKHLAS